MIAGDLEELWHDALDDGGPAFARHLFWRQTLASLAVAARPPRYSSPSPRPRGDHTMADLFHDLGFGFRLLLRRPVFAATAILMLTLGIAAVTASYSVLHSVLVRPLPYHDASRVVFLLGWDTVKNRMNFNMSAATFDDLKHRSHSFAALGAYRSWSANLANLEGGDPAERIQAYRLTDGTLSLLGVQPALGRMLAGDAEGEAVLSWRMFRDRFGADPDVIGRSVTLDGEPYTVVGVMPESFEFPVFNFRGDLWTGWHPDRSIWVGDRRRAPSVVSVARLRADVSVAGAQAELDALSRQLAQEHPVTDSGRGVHALPMQQLLVEQMGTSLGLSFAALVLVLLLTCVSVANLLLVRAVERQREMAIRSTLGAGTSRLLRQLLAEGLCLALVAGILGAALAAVALHALRANLPDFFVRTVPSLLEVGLHPPIVLFVVLVVGLVALLFGLAPAWGSLHIDLRQAVHGAGGSRAGSTLRKVLVAVQVAFALVLLVVTGLLMHTYERILRVDPGFDPERVLTLKVALPANRYPDAAARLRFYRRALERVEALPGVEAAAWVNTLPFSTSDSSTRVRIEGQPTPPPGEEPRVGDRAISPDYFDTLAIPVLRGRPLTGADWGRDDCVAVVNRTMDQTLFGGRAIGQRLRPGPGADGAWCEIVGVVGDVLHWQLTQGPRAELFLPLSQWTPASLSLAVRSTTTPASMIESVRAALRELAPHQPVFDVATLDTLVGNSLAARTVALASLGSVGSAALLLALMGLYGIVAYALSQSTRQLGLRIALGARPRHISAVLLAEGLLPALAGGAAGLVAVAALAGSGVLDALLFEVSPRDPLTFAAGTGLMLLAALLACLLPAWRARHLDPAAALRSE